MRILHLSDIHVWSLAFNPLRLLGKRSVGMFELLTGRARRFRLDRLESVVGRAAELHPDHVLITGDLTTTALPREFQAARSALAPLLSDRERATVLPGNHDRYTRGSVRDRAFEAAFGEFAPSRSYPWMRRLDAVTAVLGLDPTRSHVSARGRLPASQLEAARRLAADRPERLIVACHYPVSAPGPYRGELGRKRMSNSGEVASWLAGVGPHLYCCGHVHAAWAFAPEAIPGQLCLNSGAPILRDPTGRRLPGFLEINLDRADVAVTHHAWKEDAWAVIPLASAQGFFVGRPPATSDPIEAITRRP